MTRALTSFTPFAGGALIRMASLYANVPQVGQPARLEELLTTISEGSARLISLGDEGLEVSHPADVAIIAAPSPAMAVAAVVAMLGVFNREQRTAGRGRPSCLPPDLRPGCAPWKACDLEIA